MQSWASSTETVICNFVYDEINKHYFEHKGYLLNNINLITILVIYVDINSMTKLSILLQRVKIVVDYGDTQKCVK